MRFVVTTPTGEILRHGYASEPGAQAQPGELAFTIEDSDGGVIPDGGVRVDPVACRFVALPGYAVPVGTLHQVAQSEPADPLQYVAA